MVGSILGAMFIADGSSVQFDFHGPLYVVWFNVALILLLAVLSLFLLKLRPRGNPSSDRFWKAKVFYVNPDDPALFVVKRFGIGYTLNFGNPWSWAVVALIAAATIAPLIFAFHAIHSR